MPDAITDLIGKTFKFGVYVNKDNVDYGADIFNIGKIWAVNEIISEDDDTVTNVVYSDRSSGQVCTPFSYIDNIINIYKFYILNILQSFIDLPDQHRRGRQHMFVLNSSFKT